MSNNEKQSTESGVPVNTEVTTREMSTQGSDKEIQRETGSR